MKVSDLPKLPIAVCIVLSGPNASASRHNPDFPTWQQLVMVNLRLSSTKQLAVSSPTRFSTAGGVFCAIRRPGGCGRADRRRLQQDVGGGHQSAGHRLPLRCGTAL